MSAVATAMAAETDTVQTGLYYRNQTDKQLGNMRKKS